MTWQIEIVLLGRSGFTSEHFPSLFLGAWGTLYKRPGYGFESLGADPFWQAAASVQKDPVEVKCTEMEQFPTTFCVLCLVDMIQWRCFSVFSTWIQNMFAGAVVGKNLRVWGPLEVKDKGIKAVGGSADKEVMLQTLFEATDVG